jgi:hypothetical protein
MIHLRLQHCMLHLFLSEMSFFLSQPCGSWKLSNIIAHVAHASINSVGVQNRHRDISMKIVDNEMFPWKLTGEIALYRNI